MKKNLELYDYRNVASLDSPIYKSIFLQKLLTNTKDTLEKIMQEYRTWTYLILFIIIFAETGFVVTPFLPGDSMLFAVGALVAGNGTGLNIWFMLIILIIVTIHLDIETQI